MEMKPGASATLLRTFSQRDFDRFAALSGDDNPIHVDPEFAARTRFGRTVAHGMLLYSAICAALAEVRPDGFPPPRSGAPVESGLEQLEQELMFLTPTYTGEKVAVCLEVTAVDEARGTVEIVTNVVRPGGEFACQGRTVVTLPGTEHLEDARPKGFSKPVGSEAAEHKGLRVGERAETVRTFTAADLREYRELSGDPHPTERVPGGLLGGLFSYLLGTKLPGRGTNWLKQRLEYPEPCFAGEEIVATVEITRLRPEKDLVNLRGECAAGGRVVCVGESLVLVKDLEEQSYVVRRESGRGKTKAGESNENRKAKRRKAGAAYVARQHHRRASVFRLSTFADFAAFRLSPSRSTAQHHPGQSALCLN